MIDRQNLELEKISGTIESSKTTVNSFYAVDFQYPMSVVESTMGVLKHGLLPWARSGVRETVIIRIPGITPDQVTHEMSHFALRKLTATQPLPIWFDEGLACFVSNQNIGGNRQRLKEALETTGLPKTITWKGLIGKFRWLSQMYVSKNSDLIYGQSFYMIGFLLEKFDKPLLLDFIHSLAEAEFDESFSQCFGISQDSFYENFIKKL